MFMQDIHEGVLVKDMSSTGLGLLTVEWLTYNFTIGFMFIPCPVLYSFSAREV